MNISISIGEQSIELELSSDQRIVEKSTFSNKSGVKDKLIGRNNATTNKFSISVAGECSERIQGVQAFARNDNGSFIDYFSGKRIADSFSWSIAPKGLSKSDELYEEAERLLILPGTNGQSVKR